jgi:hypothetical protein
MASAGSFVTALTRAVRRGYPGHASAANWGLFFAIVLAAWWFFGWRVLVSLVLLPLNYLIWHLAVSHVHHAIWWTAGTGEVWTVTEAPAGPALSMPTSLALLCALGWTVSTAVSFWLGALWVQALWFGAIYPTDVDTLRLVFFVGMIGGMFGLKHVTAGLGPRRRYVWFFGRQQYYFILALLAAAGLLVALVAGGTDIKAFLTAFGVWLVSLLAVAWNYKWEFSAPAKKYGDAQFADDAALKELDISDER